MSEAVSRPDEREDDPYTIRRYRPDDREAFLALYRRVFGPTSDDWFDWKYAENPYLDHVPMFVAEAAGELVGAKPCFALAMRVGNGNELALQPADVMVHPDHRRQGLNFRMTERLVDHYTAGEPAFFFNFPNEATLAGCRKYGWAVVGTLPTYYRVQNPTAFLQPETAVGRALAALAGPLATGYLGLRNGSGSWTDDVTVRRHDEIPVGTFTSLYWRDVPRRLHALRDRRFYHWRFDNPRWTYAAYTAVRDDVPVAGVVVGRQRRNGRTVVNLVDAVPLTGGRDRRRALSRLVERVVADHPDADVVASAGDTVPASALRGFGFRSDRSFLLSRVAHPTTMVARPLAEDPDEHWSTCGVDLRRLDDWHVAFSERDTA